MRERLPTPQRPQDLTLQSPKLSSGWDQAATEGRRDAPPAPREIPGFSLSDIPLFPPGAASLPPGSSRPVGGRSRGLSFFNDQRFSRGVAQRAVGQATQGDYPFASQIAAETRGAVDPNRVPSTIVSDLPGLGVCYDGKVALRQGAGIDVARHELAHALGANEATADRAGRDPSVLSSLSGPPVDGWAVGFEFQTVHEENPKVYHAPTKKNATELADDAHPFHESGTVIMEKDGWKLIHDDADLEVVTTPVEESQAGRERLVKIMQDVYREMALIQKSGKFPSFVPYKRMVKLKQQQPQQPQPQPQQQRKLPLLAPGPAPLPQKPPLRKQQQDPQQQQQQQPQEPPQQQPQQQPQEPPRPQPPTEPLHLELVPPQLPDFALSNVAIAHSNEKDFTAHPQATVGVYFGGVFSLLERLTEQQPTVQKNDDNKGFQLQWKDNEVGWSQGSSYFKDDEPRESQQAVAVALATVKEAMGRYGGDPAFSRLQSLLGLLASYAAVGQHQKHATTNLKFVAAIMSRNNLTEVYSSLSNAEKEIYQTMLADGTLAKAFGASSMNELDARKLLKKGVCDKKGVLLDTHPASQLMLGQILRSLPSRDEIAELKLHSIHRVDKDSYKEKLEGAANQFDIGASDTRQSVNDKPARQGMFLELRRLKNQVPWPKWGEMAMAVFDLARDVNRGQEQRRKDG